MSSTPTIIIITITAILFLSTFSVPTNSSDDELKFSRRLSREDETRLGLLTKTTRQKLTHLHFFFHDVNTGPDPTAVKVAEASVTNSSATGFGTVVVADDLLTVGPEISSKKVGRAQGIFALSDQRELGVLMAINFVFTEGEFNGSSLTMLGRNEVMQKVREMPVVGGNGVFRFARGYAEARTHQFNLLSTNAVVEYNLYVYHY